MAQNDFKKPVASGYLQLDNITSGFQKGVLTILAARPKVGKTIFACNILCNSCFHLKIPTLLFSLETTKKNLMHNFVSIITNIDALNLEQGDLQDYEHDKIHKAVGNIIKSPLFIEDNIGVTIDELNKTIKQLVSRYKIELIIIDYLQLIVGKINNITTTLKTIAITLDISIVLLMQMDREVDTRNGIPKLSDLKKYGMLSANADTIIFMHKGADKLNETRVLNVAKNRNGNKGSVIFILDNNEFYEQH